VRTDPFQGPDAVVVDNSHLDESRSAFDNTGKVNYWNMEMYYFVDRYQLKGLARNAKFTDLKALGEFLHAQEDTYSHSSKSGGRDFHYYGDFFYWQDHGGAWGHFFHGHDPDHTWKDKAKAMKMAARIFTDLKTIHDSKTQDYPESIDPAAEIATDPAFEGLRSFVQQFVDFPPNVNATFEGEVVEQVTYDGYNKKIQLLDPSYKIPQAYKNCTPPEYPGCSRNQKWNILESQSEPNWQCNKRCRALLALLEAIS
jgi:hypothetical protein